MAAKANINRYRGDTDPFVFNISKDGEAVDITGSTFLLSVNVSATPEIDDYTFQLVGVVKPSPAVGIVSFTPPSPATVDLVGTYYYDVQMTTGSAIKTIVTGKIVFGQDITK